MAIERVPELEMPVTTRRTVVKTGAKLAYAAPLLAASFKLNASGGLAQSTCNCEGIEGGVPDESPYGGGDVAQCCTCEHCKSERPGETNGTFVYRGAYYNPDTNLCACEPCAQGETEDCAYCTTTGFSPTYCAPICSGCLGASPIRE